MSDELQPAAPKKKPTTGRRGTPKPGTPKPGTPKPGDAAAPNTGRRG